MTTYFVGGAVGSAVSAAAWDNHGWAGVCIVGAAFGAAQVVTAAYVVARDPRRSGRPVSARASVNG